MRHGSLEDAMGSVFALAILVTLLLCYLAVRASHTVITTAAQNPDAHGLRVALLLSLVMVLLSVATLGNATVLALTACTLAATWARARVVQLENDHLLQRPWSLTEDVLHPTVWWDAA